MSRWVAIRLLLPVVVIIVLGTIFFRHVEGWSWLDAYFFTVVTLSTVGYGSLVPATAMGKIATTVLIFFGIAIVAVAVQHLGQFALIDRAKAKARLREARRSGRETDD